MIICRKSKKKYFLNLSFILCNYNAERSGMFVKVVVFQRRKHSVSVSYL